MTASRRLIEAEDRSSIPAPGEGLVDGVGDLGAGRLVAAVVEMRSWFTP